MEKNILEQYADLLAEREDLQTRIRMTELKIAELADEQVVDSVTHGKKGGKPLKRSVIIGAPVKELKQKSQSLMRYKTDLAAAEVRIGETISEVQRYIDEIEDSRIRRILRYRYVDRLTWIQVALRMGKHHTADSCRMAAERYLQK